MNGRISRRLTAIALFAILAAVLFLTIAPSIEETRLEARIGHTYRTVCEIAESNFASDTLQSATSINETDPWGQPYRIIKTIDGSRIISNGPNQTTSATGLDYDDIYSDMPNSPYEAILRAKRRQLLIALSIPVIWLLGSIAYLSIGDRKCTERPHKTAGTA